MTFNISTICEASVFCLFEFRLIKLPAQPKGIQTGFGLSVACVTRYQGRSEGMLPKLFQTVMYFRIPFCSLLIDPPSSGAPDRNCIIQTRKFRIRDASKNYEQIALNSTRPPLFDKQTQ